MKVRFSILAATAGVVLALPNAAAANAQATAAPAATELTENQRRLRCILDNVGCDEFADAVGVAIYDEPRPVRERIGTAVSKTSGGTPAAPKGASVKTKSSGLSSTGSAGYTSGRGRGPNQAGAVEVPEALRGTGALYITFRLGSAAIDMSNPRTKEELTDLAKMTKASLAAGNKRVIQIGGHTDATGDDDTNLKLSEARAQAVRAALLELDVPADAIQAVGYGESRLIEGYAPTHGVNRRVELVVVN